jgi:hypothetical protein
MAEPRHFLNVAWALTTLLEVVLLAYLLRRKLYRTHPAFFLYVLMVILQSLVQQSCSWYWGSDSLPYWTISWGSQAVVICARWFAVVEIARRAMAMYMGIWGMVSRILIGVSALVLAYSIAVSERQWTLGVLNADRSLELCISAFIVCLFLFARYYRMPMNELERRIAVGFCLYSCAWVINDSIYESWRGSFGHLWDYINIFAFFGSLLLWIGAARKYSELPNVTAPNPLPAERYGELSRELNSRLHLLNNRLDHLLHSEDSRL